MKKRYEEFEKSTTKPPRGIISAVVGSFLTESRNLIELLYGSDKRDARARDYFHDPSVWLKDHAKCPEDLFKVRGRISKQVSHLSLSRTEYTEDQVTWDMQEIVGYLLPLLKKLENATATANGVVALNLLGAHEDYVCWTPPPATQQHQPGKLIPPSTHHHWQSPPNMRAKTGE